MRYLYLIFFSFFYTSLISQKLNVSEINNADSNVELNIDNISAALNSDQNKIFIRGFYFENNKVMDKRDIYSCIPIFGIKDTLVDIKFQLYIGRKNSFTFKVKDDNNYFKIKTNTGWENHDLYIFLNNNNALKDRLDEYKEVLKIEKKDTDNPSDMICYQVSNKIIPGSEFCYILERLYAFIEGREKEEEDEGGEEEEDEGGEEEEDFFSIELQNTSRLNSKYNNPNSNDFLSNYSNINFFEVGADVRFNLSPKKCPNFTVTPGIGYRNSTQGITNKIDNGDYSIEMPEGFISSKNIYLNNIEESIDFNLHSLNVFAGCEYSIKEEKLSISAEIFGRYYIPGTVESRLTAGTFSYRASSDAINEELMDISELGLLENVEAKMYDSQTNKINGFGLGANLNLNYQFNNLFIFGGFSFTRNSFSIVETDSSTKLSSELNNYKSTISISKGFKNNTLGLNFGVGYKFK